jgi:hypothetical protein
VRWGTEDATVVERGFGRGSTGVWFLAGRPPQGGPKSVDSYALRGLMIAAEYGDFRDVAQVAASFRACA